MGFSASQKMCRPSDHKYRWSTVPFSSSAYSTMQLSFALLTLSTGCYEGRFWVKVSFPDHLLVSRLKQRLQNRFPWNWVKGWDLAQERIHSILRDRAFFSKEFTNFPVKDSWILVKKNWAWLRSLTEFKGAVGPWPRYEPYWVTLFSYII